ncbi:amidase [Candidimonas sp. SYP-B2681]|uniref:amidase n=1 Tax=Candidimonas sp. SYP-B2681 TaxID=2497686 RepID=UPI000F8945CC|nr:amidase [Candidimonas sp. SYP-B2681]RTZ38868.1 amidase [Candidimonas sp. SYP-B2681]
MKRVTYHLEEPATGQADVWRLSAAQLHRQYLEGMLTPRAVADACLARLDAVNPQLNAVIARRDEAFLRDADASAERYARGQPLSPLDGVPVSIKDNLQTGDLPTTWGSPALRQHVADNDELPVARLRAAGALIIGKTNLPEFALEGYTDNSLFGATVNPWDLALTPGGSSGGAVASVAAGVTPIALGTDGGGSIRRPASHCGLVGFKPSIGSIARDGGLPSLLLDFEVAGPLARSVIDARTLFNVLRGPHPNDRRSYAAESAKTPVPEACESRATSLRILYVPTLDNAPVDFRIATRCHDAMATLRELGHDVQQGELPLDLSFMTQAWPVIGQVGLARLFQRHPQWREACSTKYLDMAEQGSRHEASLLWQIIEDVEALRRDCVDLFSEYDILITPATAALPWPAGEAFPPIIAGQPVGPRGHAVFTAWVNAAGLPALAVPVAPSPEGLPMGIQMISRYGADDLLLDLGEAYEAASPWAHRWPSIGTTSAQ